MSRSLKKGLFVDDSLIKQIDKYADSTEKPMIKTWSRASMVIPKMVGFTISVHNGRKHVPVMITEDMVGHKLGEFVETRTFRGHRKVDEKTSG